MKKHKKFFQLKKYKVHQSERIGLGIFVSLLALGAVFTYFFPRKKWRKNKALLEVRLNNLDNEVALKASNNKEETELSTRNNNIALKSIDLNSARKEDLLAIGLSDKKAQTLINFRAKGAQFRNIQDVEKVYGLSKKDIDNISPYLYFSDNKKQNKVESSNQVQNKKLIAINNCSASDLQKIKGIGPVLSERIIKYRDALGGFYTKEQLKEVYNLPDSTYEYMQKLIIIDVNSIKKINLNTCSQKELKAHPYLREHHKEILDLREKLTKFESPTELKQISLINEENYLKFAPYLEL